MSVSAWCGLILVIMGAPQGGSQEFDRLDGGELSKLVRGDLVQKQAALEVHELMNLPTTLAGTRGPVLIVKTDQGNFTRILPSLALRQPADRAAKPLPVVSLDRFETFEPGSQGKRMAEGRDRLLFESFLIDLDTGQIVPPGCGADLAVQSNQGRVELSATGEAELFSLARSPFAQGAGTARRPAGVRQVRPVDFSGRYRLVANGQWTGDLDLEVDDQGHAKGKYRSDQTGSVYQVRGQTARATAHQIDLTIQFPRSELALTGWMWTEGKGAFGGSARLDDRPYGFIAVRAGESLAGMHEPAVGAGGTAGFADLDLAVNDQGSASRAGAAVDADQLRELLRQAREAAEIPTVRLTVSPACPYRTLAQLIAELEQTGPLDIRLGTGKE